MAAILALAIGTGVDASMAAATEDEIQDTEPAPVDADPSSLLRFLLGDTSALPFENNVLDHAVTIPSDDPDPVSPGSEQSIRDLLRGLEPK